MHHGPTLDPLSWASFMSTWQFRLGWTITALVLIGLYALFWARARRRAEPLSVWRLVMWVVGVALLLYTMSSGIDAYAMALFWMHMTEHLMLIMVIPVFLVWGSPLRLIRANLSTQGQARFDVVMGKRSPIGWLFHPVVAFVIYTVVIVGTHLTGFMDDMAMDERLMLLEQLLYLVSGWIFFTPLVGDEPLAWRFPTPGLIGLMMVGMMPDTIVGIVLMQSTVNVFPMYMAMRPDWATPAMKDLYYGGSMMWGVGDGLMMLFALILMFKIVANPRKEAVFGKWLEGARTAAFTDHLESGGESYQSRDGDGSIDDDDEALAAYNRMLERLSRHD
ncbi:MAG TPA: cytochrome c oxidase assembly protein [Marmoricola sp.]|nr:cytochrome c oxidase assembly protein [Marmoricola sp.]